MGRKLVLLKPSERSGGALQNLTDIDCQAETCCKGAASISTAAVWPTCFRPTQRRPRATATICRHRRPQRFEPKCAIVHKFDVMRDAFGQARLSGGCLPAPWIVTSEVPLLSMQRLAFGVAFLAVLVLAAKPSTAQTWPQRAVKFIVTLGPGSGVDIGARLIGDRLSRRWGQPVVVENRPGGDGLVAISA